jgi:hypothetical protein
VSHGKSLGHLPRKPILRGICRNKKMNDLSAVKSKHDQGIEQTERRRGHHEHVDRGDVGKGDCAESFAR